MESTIYHRVEMRVSVKAKPGAKTEKIEAQPDGSLLVAVKAPPVDGKANEAIIAALAKHFGVKRSAVELKSGASSRTKQFEVSL